LNQGLQQQPNTFAQPVVFNQQPGGISAAASASHQQGPSGTGFSTQTGISGGR